MSTHNILTAQQTEDFLHQGFLILPAFYKASEIEKIQQGVHSIIGILLKKYNVPHNQKTFSTEDFDDGYKELITANRAFGGEVYDAIKQIPSFFRMVGDQRHEILFRELRKNSMPGLAAAGYGIRIDNPNEEKFRAPWHQEYPAQLRSPDGLVFWSSLVPILPEMGPVKICVGSHTVGPVPVHTKDPKNPEKSGAYSLILKDEEGLIANFEQVSPCTKPGDLILMDFLVLHSSGYNRGKRSRWSMQFRYFNFADPVGIRIGWQGSFASGQDFRSFHPELCID